MNSNLLTLIVTMFLRSLGSSIIQPIFSIYLRSLGLSIAELGLSYTGNAIGLLLSESFWGILADRGHTKKILIMAYLTMPLTTFAYTLIRGFWPLFVLRFLEGSMFAATAISTRSLLASLSPERKGRAFGLWSAMWGLGGLTGPVIGGYLAETNYSLPFYVSVAVSIAALLSAIWIANPQKVVEKVNANAVEKEKTPATWRILFESKAFVVASFIAVFLFFVMGSRQNFLSVYVHESPSLMLSASEVGLLFSVMNLVGIPAPLLFGELSDRFGRKVLIIMGLILDGCTLWLLPFASNIYELALISAGSSIAWAAVDPSLVALVADDVQPYLRGRALGIYGSFEDLGVLLGSFIGGYFYEFYGSTSYFNLCAVLMIFTATFAYILFKKMKFLSH